MLTGVESKYRSKGEDNDHRPPHTSQSTSQASSSSKSASNQYEPRSDNQSYKMKFSTFFTTLTLPTSTFSAPLSSRRRLFGAWDISDFTRDITHWDSCTYHFTILTGAKNSQVYTVVDNADDAISHAWYNVPCEENPNYHISWGWDYANDFTVMTVVLVPEQWGAFFGYNHPSDEWQFAVYSGMGPNVVQWTGVSA